MLMRKLPLAKTMVRVQILPVRAAQRGIAEKSEVFCPTPLGPRTFVWTASIALDPRLTPEQTTHPSVRIQARYSGLLSGPRRGRDRFLRTGRSRFGGSPPCNGTLRRNNTRLLSINTSTGFQLENSARPGRHNGIQNRALFVYSGVTVQDDRTRPPNSSCAIFPRDAEHRLPVRTIHPGFHCLLCHAIEDLGGPDVRLVDGVGLPYDLHGLCLHQAVDSYCTAGAGRDLLVGG
jgi:hypothetical protein